MDGVSATRRSIFVSFPLSAIAGEFVAHHAPHDRLPADPEFQGISCYSAMDTHLKHLMHKVSKEKSWISGHWQFS